MNIPEKLRQAYNNDLTDVPLLLDAADEIDRLSAEWQPIETAPMNGRRVLLFESKPVRTISIARWVAAPHDVWISDNGSYLRRATHWMELPAPPPPAPIEDAPKSKKAHSG